MTLAPRREPPPWLPPLSAALAEALPRLYGAPADPLVLELMEALTLALERGEIALALRGSAPDGIRSEGWPIPHRDALAASPLAADPHGPLAWDDQRVGWRRWLQSRSTVLDALAARARTAPAAPLPEPDLPEGLDPDQRQAIRIALARDLLVLAGGPGTGKTSTVAHLLRALAWEREGVVIQLAAPTGKAAARLRQATAGHWPCGTLHQLLECRADGVFRRHRLRPLALDVLVVDEVSMVDLALMEALLDALPDRARLVLVGDPAQLPPVAPGAPLREVLRGAGPPALAEAIVTLRTTHRNDGAIATVAAALRAAIDAADAPDGAASPEEPLRRLRPLLRRLPPTANLRWREAAPGPLPAAVRQRLEEHRRQLREIAAVCAPGEERGWRELLALRDALLVLTPRHRGPWGVRAVHRELLGEQATRAPERWPAGTPVLCTRNLPALGLSNGDLGVLAGGDQRWLLFGQEEPIWVHPAQVGGAVEAALALTAHKAQGSESQCVMVLLPGPDPTDPRLLYTALTRARQEAWLFTPPSAAGEMAAEGALEAWSGLPQTERPCEGTVVG